MKKRSAHMLFMIALAFCVLWHAEGHGQVIFQDVQINSSPNPVGSGARAMGMGGAFIAVADDATAASWNPGGLMQLERPEVSFVFAFEHRRKDYESSARPEFGRLHEIHREDLNYFSVAYPFQAFDKNMIISLNYQKLYDLYDKLNFNNSQPIAPFGTPATIYTHTRFRQTGSVKALAPAFAVQVTPHFSLGITLNFWTDNLGYDNGWKNRMVTTSYTSFLQPFTGSLLSFRGKSVTENRYENFEGFNVNIGFLWDLNRVITLGGVVKTPFTADIDLKTYTKSVTFGSSSSPPTRPLLSPLEIPLESRESIEMKFPLSYGLGVAFRLSDELTIALDVYRTNWSDYWLKTDARTSNPVTGRVRGRSHMHDTTQVRLGGEYLFVLDRTLVPLRVGLFYDPQPSEKNPEDYYGFSLGTGIMLGDVVLDCAYIYRWGRDVQGETIGVQQAQADVDQHSLYVSMIYHF